LDLAKFLGGLSGTTDLSCFGLIFFGGRGGGLSGSGVGRRF